MKTKLTLFVTLGILLVVFIGCSKDESPVVPMNALSTVSIGGINGIEGEYCTTLYAGQDIDAGTVCVAMANDGEDEFLNITYTTTGGWELVETHLWVGTVINDMPQTRKGNPKVGNFLFQSGDITGQTTYTFSVDLDLIDGDYCSINNLLAAAHAALQLVDDGGGVTQTETGWGNGESMVDRGNWGTYFGIQLTCGDAPLGQKSETAFAYDCPAALCFIDIEGEDFNRWGWTNGPYEEGTYYLDIYAGAGQCDISKGTLVGLLTLEYYDGVATVTYNTCGSYTMTETHVYVGNELLAYDNNDDDPGLTIAPGQFPSINSISPSLNTSEHIVTGLSGEIYVVAHAVVWGDYDVDGDCRSPGFDYIGFEEALDDIAGSDGIVTLNVVHQGGDSTKPYFTGSLDTTTGLPFYCIDLVNTIASNTDYCARLFSTYDLDNMPGDVNYPGNLDLLNYVLNNYAIGDPGVDGLITGGDIQRALWKLIHGGELLDPGAYSSGSSSDARVNEILDAAIANGVGFEPPCDGIVGVVVFPVDCDDSELQLQTLIAQMLVTEFPAICTGCP